MPQIGWSEILVIILVAILVIGPKDLPVVLRKFIQIKNGIKNYVNSFQNFDYPNMGFQNKIKTQSLILFVDQTVNMCFECVVLSKVLLS